MIIKVLSVLSIGLLLSGCIAPKKDTKVYYVNNFNIIIAPDLSNRVLDIKPVADTQIVQTIVSHIPDILQISNRETGQIDIFTVRFINKDWINNYNINSQLLTIDFSKFEDNQEKRINYIVGDGNNSQLKTDQKKFINEYSRVNALAVKNNSGADVWSFFNNGIDKTMIKKAPNTDSSSSVKENYRNILILLTDGYIEAGIYNKGYDLSGNNVKRLRLAYLNSGQTDFKKFFNDHKEYHIKAVSNESLSNLEVLVLEIYDRSLTLTGNATVHPTDSEIIQVAWAEWFKESGVKRFEMHPTFPSISDADKTIMTFFNN